MRYSGETGGGLPRSYAFDGNDWIVTSHDGRFLARCLYGPGEKEPLYHIDHRSNPVQVEYGTWLECSGSGYGPGPLFTDGRQHTNWTPVRNVMVHVVQKVGASTVWRSSSTHTRALISADYPIPTYGSQTGSM
jgi:hypothetical protein